MSADEGRSAEILLPLTRILVGTDFSPCSDLATEAAIELALGFDAALTLAHVFEIPSYVYSGQGFSPVDLFSPLREAAEAMLEEALSRTRRRLPEAAGVLRSGSPVHLLADVADELRADLLVVGTHGRRGPSRLLVGSVAEGVVRHGPCPVLIVREKREEAAPRPPGV